MQTSVFAYTQVVRVLHTNCKGGLQLLLWLVFTFVHLWFLSLYLCNEQLSHPKKKKRKSGLRGGQP